MEPIKPPDDAHTLAGNIPVHKAGDVNALIRALVEGKRKARFDLLGNRISTDDD